MKNGGERPREYLTNLFLHRSVIALCSSILTLAVSFLGVTGGVIRTVEGLRVNGFLSFRYFTMLTNTLSGLSAAFVLPFAVEGIGVRRFILPRWVALFHYLSTCSITIVMTFALVFLSWISPEDAFGGTNLFTHVFCPLLILLSFFQVENGIIYSRKDWLLGCLPCGIYGLVYFLEVFAIGESRGGWADIYRIGEYLPPLLAAPLMLLFGMGISALIALLSNQLTQKRREITFLLWTEKMDPVDVKVEAYGLGRMAGLCARRSSIQMPLDILEQLAKRYDMNPSDLIRPYVVGILNGLRERK